MANYNDKFNDQVFTPEYLADMMCKLGCVNNDSKVIDNACGNGNLLYSAYKHNANELYGVEYDGTLSNETIKRFDNMNNVKIVCGDGLNVTDDISDYNVLLSNPPYSADSKGFIFTESLIDKMSTGRAVVLIQENAGSGQGVKSASNILKKASLIASIHLNSKVFIGHASVQTALYVFDIGRPHKATDIVKFIDFSNDGYTRAGRKNSTKNLIDNDNAIARYAEVIDLVLGNNPTTHYYTKDNGLLVEDTITLNGDDFTYQQHHVIDTTPTEEDFKKTVEEYLLWKINNQFKQQGSKYGIYKF